MASNDDRRIVGIRRTWITLAQADALKMCLSRIKSFHIRALVESDEASHEAYDALMIIQHQLSVALASLNLRIASRARKRNLENEEDS